MTLIIDFNNKLIFLDDLHHEHHCYYSKKYRHINFLLLHFLVPFFQDIHIWALILSISHHFLYIYRFVYIYCFCEFSKSCKKRMIIFIRSIFLFFFFKSFLMIHVIIVIILFIFFNIIIIHNNKIIVISYIFIIIFSDFLNFIPLLEN